MNNRSTAEFQGDVELTNPDVLRATIKWVNKYYPVMKGIPLRLEDPAIVRQMIADSIREGTF